MKANKNKLNKKIKQAASTFIERLGKNGWTYIKTVVDVVHEPVLILDADLRVIAANASFYKTFQVKAKDTEKTVVYELGNGQWNIPDLRRLLEDILPRKTFFRGFEVTHKFPSIGDKVMILNARQIFCKNDSKFDDCPPIILLAIEDITEMMTVAQKLADHTAMFEKKVTEKTQDLESHILGLERELDILKKA